MTARTFIVFLGAGALALAVALVYARRENQQLIASNRQIYQQLAAARYEAKSVRQHLRALEQGATALDAQLGSAKTRAAMSEFKSVLLDHELGAVTARLTEREQREVTLLAELAMLREERPRVTGDGNEPRELQQRITRLEGQLAALLVRSLETSSPAAATLLAPATFSVVKVGLRESFVVVDYGTEHGSRPGEILRLLRDDRALALVQVSDARDRFSIAQVLPRSRKEQLHSGDLVVLAR